MSSNPDHGRLVGMSIGLPRLDLEQAVRVLADTGFEAVEPHIAQLGPGILSVPLYERHGEIAGEVVRDAGLQVSSFNAVDDPSFRPFEGRNAEHSTAEGLAKHLRMADLMGAPRVLIWDGRADAPGAADTAPEILARVIAEAQNLSGLQRPPAVSVELHPFTFGLKHGRLADLASALSSVGAGICLDFCHFGVALGPDFLSKLDDAVVDAVNHVHYCDTDCRTSELHFPPGRGVLDLDAFAKRLAGRGLAVAWDLFEWEGPRRAMREHMGEYREFVRRVSA